MLCERNACCGCGLCFKICKFNAIQMKEDDEGFRYPEINESKCVHCNACTRVCPYLNKNLSNEKEKIEQKAFAGYCLEQNEILKSSSGGAAYAIAHAILKQGGVVFGVRYNEDYKGARFAMASDISELQLFSESKYVESDRSTLFDQIEWQIKSEKKVLVIGLPCDIAAVKSLVGNPANLYTCKLICRSNTSNKALRQYLGKCESDRGSAVKRISLRYKQKNVPSFPTKIRIDFENGDTFIDDFTKTDFGKAFQILARPSCLRCSYKGIAGMADLTLGDFQGMIGDEEYFNINGVSLICRHTQKGKELLSNLSNFYLKEVSYDDVIRYNWMVYATIPESPFRQEFSQDLRNEGLSVACEKLRNGQNQILDEIMNRFMRDKDKVAVWGIGDTTNYLFERLQMDKWNIVGVFDSSMLKVGKSYKEWKIRNIREIVSEEELIDVLVVMIPSEDESKLNHFLEELGWKKPILHVGKYKFYKG